MRVRVRTRARTTLLQERVFWCAYFYESGHGVIGKHQFERDFD